jgi:hypothetical protein
MKNQRKFHEKDENVEEIMMIIQMKILLMIQVNIKKRIDNKIISYYHIDMIYHKEHPQIIFIHGQGTTSLVHALAEEHNFKVRT